jgi:hypothetical protein
LRFVDARPPARAPRAGTPAAVRMQREHAVERPPPPARSRAGTPAANPGRPHSPCPAWRTFSRARAGQGRAAGQGGQCTGSTLLTRCRPPRAPALARRLRTLAGHTALAQLGGHSATRALGQGARPARQPACQRPPRPEPRAGGGRQMQRLHAVVRSCPAAGVPAPATPGAARGRGRCACKGRRPIDRAAVVPAPATPGAARARAAGRGRRTPSHS